MPFTKCPQCGHEEVTEVKHHHSVMNKYINKADHKNVVIMNRNEETFEGLVGTGDNKKKVTWVREDVFEKTQVQAQSLTPPSPLTGDGTETQPPIKSIF